MLLPDNDYTGDQSNENRTFFVAKKLVLLPLGCGPA